jgi:hypothetical protein
MGRFDGLFYRQEGQDMRGVSVDLPAKVVVGIPGLVEGSTLHCEASYRWKMR